VLKGAALPSQEVIHLLCPFRFEEDVKEDGNHSQEAGRGDHGDDQPGERGVCGERGTLMFPHR